MRPKNTVSFPPRDPVARAKMVTYLDKRLAELLAQPVSLDAYEAAWRQGSIDYCREMLAHLTGKTDAK